jgi:hypothetical protein
LRDTTPLQAARQVNAVVSREDLALRSPLTGVASTGIEARSQQGRGVVLTMTAEEERPGTLGIESLEVLERFVVENDDLLALESLIGRFNIFDALRITDNEIRHSNFLAFLLDPAESHGQGQLFLKAVLMDLFKKAPTGARPLSPIDLDGTDLRGVEVTREWKHTDLLIKCKQPPFVVVIENKIRAKEGPDQLSGYKETVEKDYPGALYVYLTLKADEPSEDDWMAYSYEAMHGVLKRVRDTNHKAIANEVLVFLDHYLDLIGTRFMDNQNIDELCQKIYKNHRAALDLIIARGKPVSGVLADVANLLNQDGRWEVDPQGPRPRCILFRPKAWKDWLPPLGLKGASGASWWICVDIRLYDDGTLLGYSVDVAPMTDPQKRVEIVNRLLDECHNFGFERPKSKTVSNNWSRVSAFKRILKWNEDEEPEPDKLREVVKKTLTDLYPKLEKMAQALKPLCKVPASAT